MDINSVSVLVGLSGPVVTALFESYKAIKKTNVEKFFKMLLDDNSKLGMIGQNEELQRYFFNITEKVANEVEFEKIRVWKNVVVSISTDFYNFEFKNDFVKILDSLTVFDLTILHIIYSSNFKGPSINDELIKITEGKKINKEMVLLALNKLAGSNLITTFQIHGNLLPNLNSISHRHMQHKKNSLGQDFVKFCIDFEK